MVRIASVSQVLRGRNDLSRDAQLSTIAPNPVARVVHVLQQWRTSLGNQVAP